MALDLSLDEAFEELIQRLTMKEVEGISEFHMTTDEEERSLMRKSRTWFGLLVLDHIPDIAEFVHEAKVDLDLWFDAMSPVERNILLLAKSSARKHLRLISTEPDFYLAKLKYAMDFVWAKCAFCFLLLLKLSRLLPERREEHQELLDHGNRLLDELTRSVGSSGETTGNGSIYMQILRLSIEKYGRIFQEREAGGDPVATAPFWESFDAQADLQSFVPEQFVREWDFPGLNLFYFPTAWQDFFGDFSLAV
ncbi:hypothetical protein APSETT444_008836 [Aspergillus pseudonomiae]